MQLVMQSLLADRFKLRVHKEMRGLSAYTLVVDKDGPKSNSWIWKTASDKTLSR
jgi:uncharacterized protein (TIGR03435 family)